jgi:preprotein translocase subunit SecA
MAFEHAAANPVASDPSAVAPSQAPPAQPMTRMEPKVGRNDPCPCGSGKKYKQCCGALT